MLLSENTLTCAHIYSHTFYIKNLIKNSLYLYEFSHLILTKFKYLF